MTDIKESQQENVNSVYYKWEDDLRNNFRSRLISKLPEFNSITNHVDSNCNESIDLMLKKFTSILHDVADPLFRKEINVKKRVSFNGSSVTLDQPWFDHECDRSRHLYMNALSAFNRFNSDINREQLYLYKKRYKTIVKKKRRMYKFKHVREIEKLRFSKPKEFWKFSKIKVMLNIIYHLMIFSNIFPN
jgi:hypothetical protein